MKKICIILVFILTARTGVQAQAQEIQQLLLNITKLTQFKQILSDMKKGYEILTKGYNTVKDISEGSFNLHQTFLDGLFEVSPSVRKYKKIAGIIDMQVKLMNNYKTAFNRFRQSGQFSAGEIDYLSRVYGRLFDQGIKDLDDLSVIVTAGKLRMSDDERLAAIDRLHDGMEDKLLFLSDFNGKTGVLAMARAKEAGEVRVMQDLYRP